MPHDGCSFTSSVLTILRSASGRPLTKQYHLDRKGKVCKSAYSNEKYFSAEFIMVTDIRGLAASLGRLERDHIAAVVRGALLDTADPERTRRLLHPCPKNGDPATFGSDARSYVMIDIDGITCPAAIDPVGDPEGGVEYLIGLLPPEFHDATCYWQWSSSQGMKGELLSAHLWFWLDRPIEDRDLREWAHEVNASYGSRLVDPALFNPIQLHYTAAPIFGDGVADPLPRRSGLRLGLEEQVAVVLPEKAERLRASGEGTARTVTGVDTYIAEIGGPRGFHQPIN